MKTYTEVTVLEGKLSKLLDLYIEPLRIGRGFECFSNEAILYALLEYSRFNRNMTNDVRILYLCTKCLAYMGSMEHPLGVTYDVNGNFSIEYELPF